MKHPLSTLLTDAFPADGEASAARLQAAITQAEKKGIPTMKRRRTLALCAALVLISASAVTAKVLLERHTLHQNGAAIGTMTTTEQGTVELNLTKDPGGAPMEVRTEAGAPAGQAIFVPR